MINPAEIRRLIDEYFSLAWCRENVVIPLGISRENAGLIQSLAQAGLPVLPA